MEHIYSIAATDDNHFLLVGDADEIGAGDDDIYLIKIDSAGDTVWTRTFGGVEDEFPKCVIQTDDGGCLIVGRAQSFGGGDWDIYIVKVHEGGNLDWYRTYGDTGGDIAVSAIQLDNGHYVVAGSIDIPGAAYPDLWLAELDTNGDTLWTNTFGNNLNNIANCVIQKSNGGYAIAGLTDPVTNGQTGMYLIGTDWTGLEEWSEIYGGIDNFYHAYSILQADDGGFLVAGYIDYWGITPSDILLMKTDDQGDSIWTRTYGDTEEDNAYSMIQTSDGNFLIAGYTESYGDGGDVYVIKVDPSGNEIWSRHYGDFYYEDSNCVVETQEGHYLVGGHTTSSPSWGGYLVCIEGPGSGVTPEISSIPTQFRFFTPYPNPFNPSTIIRFDLPVASLVEFEIFDIHGRNVTSFQLPATSSHDFTFDGTGLPSGIYFARLTAGNFQQTQKLVLLK